MYARKCLMGLAVVSIAAGSGETRKQPTTQPTEQQQDFYDRGYADAEQSFEEVFEAYDKYIKELESKVKSEHRLDSKPFEYERGFFAGQIAEKKEWQAEVRTLKKQLAKAALDVKEAEEQGRRQTAAAQSKDYRLGYEAGRKDGYREGYTDGYKDATDKYKKGRL